MWGLAPVAFVVSTFCIGLVFAEWEWLRAIIDWPWLWLPTMAIGLLFAIPFIIAGFLFPPTKSED